MTSAGWTDRAELGLCSLCGQEMIRTDDDCWHPWSVATACPPEPASNDWSLSGWPAFYAKGLRTGRPGREHFVPAERPFERVLSEDEVRD